MEWGDLDKVQMARDEVGKKDLGATLPVLGAGNGEMGVDPLDPQGEYYSVRSEGVPSSNVDLAVCAHVNHWPLKVMAR